MDTTSHNNAPFYVRHGLTLILISIILGLTLFFGVKAYLERPQDLGPGLEYIGKSNYGCWFVCDSTPASVYYFATDMTQDELKTYFKGATYVEHPNSLGGGGAGYNFSDLYFRPRQSDREFLIDYYDNTQLVIGLFKLKQTNRHSVISISEKSYTTVLDALN
jgi:hypothetical protein